MTGSIFSPQVPGRLWDRTNWGNWYTLPRGTVDWNIKMIHKPSRARCLELHRAPSPCTLNVEVFRYRKNTIFYLQKKTYTMSATLLKFNRKLTWCHHLNIERKIYEERIFLHVQHSLPVDVPNHNSCSRSVKTAAFVRRYWTSKNTSMQEAVLLFTCTMCTFFGKAEYCRLLTLFFLLFVTTIYADF
jgi:hypothetical protein